MNDRMVWIDCEMTGLSLSDDALIEVAALVTDSELNVLGDGVDIVIRPAGRRPWRRCRTWCARCTPPPGCWTELAGGTTLADAEEQVLAYVREHVKEPGKAPLCGNSVGTDRGFLLRDMPTLEDYLHYRIVDVSSVKELARRWYPRAYFNSPDKNGNHRALADIRESIAELRYYREASSSRSPGPTRTPPAPSPHEHVLPRPNRAAAEALGGPREKAWREHPFGPCTLFLGRSEKCTGPDMVGVAQLVEHLVVVQEAAGSSPVTHPD